MSITGLAGGLISTFFSLYVTVDEDRFIAALHTNIASDISASFVIPRQW